MARTNWLVWMATGCGILTLLVLVGIVGVVVFVASFGLGPEIASTSVIPRVPYELTYRSENDSEYEVWLDLDVEFEGDSRVAGPIEVYVGSELHAARRLLLDANDRSPIVGNSRRRWIGWTRVRTGETAHVTGTTRLFSVPVGAGEDVRISGDVVAEGARVNGMRLFVVED